MINDIHTMPESILYGRTASVELAVKRFWKQGTSQYGRIVRKTSPFSRNWVCSWTGHEIGFDGESPVEDWLEFERFIDTIEGPTGMFYLHDPYRERPRGVATGIGETVDQAIYWSDGGGFTDGSPLIGPGNHIGWILDNADAGADTITITGMVPSRSDCLYAGDRFAIAHGGSDIWTLYKALAPAVSNAAGEAVVTIYPRLRYPVLGNQVDKVNFYRPAGVFMLASDPEMVIRPPVNMVPRFTAVENPSILYELDRSSGRRL